MKGQNLKPQPGRNLVAGLWDSPPCSLPKHVWACWDRDLEKEHESWQVLLGVWACQEPCHGNGHERRQVVCVVWVCKGRYQEVAVQWQVLLLVWACRRRCRETRARGVAGCVCCRGMPDQVPGARGRCGGSLCLGFTKQLYMTDAHGHGSFLSYFWMVHRFSCSVPL